MRDLRQGHDSHNRLVHSIPHALQDIMRTKIRIIRFRFVEDCTIIVRVA